MKRNIAVLVLTAFMLQMLALTSYAADSDNKWSISYYGGFAPESTRASYAAQISNGISYDGDMALNVVCMAASRNDADYIEIKNTLAEELKTGRYTLEFYVRKNSRSGGGEVHIGDTVIDTENMDITSADAPNGSDNWSKYSKTFDYTGSGDKTLTFRFYSRIVSYIIDNVSLTAEGDNTNQIGDPGFEEYFEDKGGEQDEPYDTEPYQPKSMRFTKMNDRASLNWKNPAADTLSKISVYDVTDGEGVLLTDELSTEANKIIYCYTDELASGANYIYKIVFSFTDKGDYIYYLGGTPSPKVSEQTFGKWMFSNNMGGKYEYVPSVAYVDGTEAHSGDASFKMASSVSMISEDNMNGNIYMKLQQKLPLEIGKTYKISFWIKADDLSHNFNATMWFDLFNGNGGRPVIGSNGTYDWKKYEYDYTYGLEAAHDQDILLLFYEGYAESIWIDDVECYELDENGEKIGDNMVVNGDFEGLLKAEEASIRSLSATEENGGATLTWKNGGAKFGGVDIYQKVFDNYEYRGTLNDGISLLKMSGLDPGGEYSFRLVPFNTDRVSGSGAEVSLTTLVPEIDINKPSLTLDGKTVREIKGAGRYKLSISAKNNVLDEGLKYEVIAALYDKDDTLIGVSSAAANVLKRPERAPYSTKEIYIDVPEDEGSYLEVYVIDSRETLNRFYDTVVYGSADNDMTE